MDSLLKSKRVLKSKISRLQSAVEQQIPPKGVEAQLLLERAVQLTAESENLFSHFSQICSEEEYVVIESEFEMLEMKLRTMNIKLLELLSQQREDLQNTVRGSAEIKLPRIELPTFSGNYSEWLTFHDLFTAAIHCNTKLSGAQRLQYLKAALKGEASGLIQSIPITDANYEEAWDILNLRYQNTKEILTAHLDRLFNQTGVTVGSASSLRELVDNTNECVRALRIYEAPVDHWDIVLVYTITRMLDSITRQEWELVIDRQKMPTFNQLMEFLDKRAHALAAATPITQSRDSLSTKKTASTHIGMNTLICPFCKASHYLYRCSEFLKLSVKQRQIEVKRLHLCFNCLKSSHQAYQCQAKHCQKCTLYHNTLLHIEKSTCNTMVVTDDNSSVTTHFSEQPTVHQVLLSTAIIRVFGADDEVHEVRALLDSASQCSFITENCFKKLGLRQQHLNMTVLGLGALGGIPVRGITSLRIISHVQPTIVYNVDAVVLANISTAQPTFKIQENMWTHLNSLDLADPKYFQPSKIDILLGADIFGDLLLGKVCKGSTGTPVAMQTTLGWVLSGQLNTQSPRVIASHHAQVLSDNMISQFWELDDEPANMLQTREDSMKQHKIIHTKKKSFQCDHCSYITFYKRSLIAHEMIHTQEKTFLCDVCDYKSNSKANLVKHSMVHSGNKPFHCLQCNYKSTQKAHLMVHVKRHSGERPFSCDQCDYKSILKKNLNLHKWTHVTSKKPFKCDVCDFSTAQKYNFDNHKNLHFYTKYNTCQSDSSISKEFLNALKHNYVNIVSGRILRKCKKKLYRIIKCKYCDFKTSEIGVIHEHNLVHSIRLTEPDQTDVLNKLKSCIKEKQ